MGKRTLFLVFHVSRYVCFWEKTLHFAPFCLSILVAGSYFFSPNYLHLTPKTPLFNGYFVHFGRAFHGSDGFCLYRYSVFLYFFVSCFAPFYAAFSTILPCVLHQNALYFAPKRTAFSGILHHILPKIAPNLVLMAVVCNKYSFCCIRGLTHFCPKINSRENRFFAARLAIGDENGTHNVKSYADKMTKASPQAPLQERGRPHPRPLSKREEGLTPDPSPRGEGSGMRCWLARPHTRWCQACGGLFETGISAVADHIYNGKRDALCCYG